MNRRGFLEALETAAAGRRGKNAIQIALEQGPETAPQYMDLVLPV